MSSTPMDALAQSSPSTTTAKKLQEARAELQRTSSERRELEKGLSQTEQRLRQADARVAQASREVARVETAIAEQQQALATARERRAALQSSVHDQRRLLAQLLRNAHAQGNQTALRLLLSQQQAGESTRVLGYNRYMQKQRIEALAAVDADLKELETLELQISQQQQALAEQQEKARQVQEQLAEERRQHTRQLQQLSREHDLRKNREQALARDVRTLEGVLANLRAQAARAAAQRRQAQQREQQRQAQAQREQSKKPSTPPGSVARRGSTTAAPQAAPSVRVGGGSWPVNGSLVTRYGARLPDGRTSTGLLIEAAAGTAVSAVADGTVVFADWMTGYGNILIVDHGNGDMSLYAHNESLLRSQGQRVRRGEAVARVGSSGGQGRSALYFELRRHGQPVDPSSWLRR